MKKIKIFGFLPIIHAYEHHDCVKYYFCGILVAKVKTYRNCDGFNNKWTERIYKTCKCGKNLWCGGPTELTPQCELSDNVCFNGCEVHGVGKVVFGRSFHSGIELLIITSNHNYNSGQHIPYSPNDNIAKDVVIGDFVWVGSRVTILPGTKIGEGAIIQAGAVVHGDVPPLAIVGGNPAQIIKYRDKEHFYKLKEQGNFN